MVYPSAWDDFLNSPVFILNLDRQPDRLERCINHAKDAGFTDIRRFAAIDGNDEGVVNDLWKQLGNPTTQPLTERVANVKHVQGVLLTHLMLYRHIHENSIPFAVILEDDCAFHKDWSNLGPKYLQITPKDYDVCYLGHHSQWGTEGHVMSFPVYCTNAYCITLQGATYLHTLLSDVCASGTGNIQAIDLIIFDLMAEYIKTMDDTKFCKWYIWNAAMFPDDTAKKHPTDGYKDNGLVYQEYIT